MSARTVTLFSFPCSGETRSSTCESLIQEAKGVIQFNPHVDNFQVAFVAVGENIDQPQVSCSEPVDGDVNAVSLLLVKHQVTSVPCIVVNHGNGENEVITLRHTEEVASDAAVTDGHFISAVEAYNEFDICKAVSR